MITFPNQLLPDFFDVFVIAGFHNDLQQQPVMSLLPVRDTGNKTLAPILAIIPVTLTN